MTIRRATILKSALCTLAPLRFFLRRPLCRRFHGVRVSLCILLLFAASPSRADDEHGGERPYLALGSGFVHLQDAPVTYGGGALPNRSVGFQPGWAIEGALGWTVTEGKRVELEISHRSNNVKIVTPGSSPGGSETATTFMVNGYLDVPTGTSVTPYFGAGIGGAMLHQKIAADGTTLTDSNSNAFAYQFIGGLGVALAPSLTLTLDYRYLATTNPTYSDRNGFSYDSRYQSHNLLLGLRWQL